MNPANLPAVANIATLRKIPVLGGPQFPIVYVESYATLGDGGEGIFAWSASTSSADNIGTIINPTGNGGNGRWLRQFDGPLHDLWFGVVADGSTDDTAALQACEDAANALNIRQIFYPARPHARVTTTGITTYAGIQHTGAGMQLDPILAGGSYNQGPSTILNTGNVNAFVFTTPQAAMGGGGIQSPCWRDMSIICSSSSGQACGIQLNQISGGFDANPSQHPIEGCLIERCAILVNARFNSFCVQWSKVFNSTIRDCFFFGGDYTVWLTGSDNCGIYNNHLDNCTINLIRADSNGTFGNMIWIRDNTLSSPYTNSAGHIATSYRIAYIQDNYFECQSNGLSYGININGGAGNIVITNNEMDVPISACANWLTCTTTLLSLKADNNFNANTSLGPALFNSGNGHRLLNNGTAVIITGGNNYNRSIGLPFITNNQLQPLNNLDIPVAGIGSVIWDISPNTYGGGLTGSGSYDANVTAANGAYRLPAAAFPGTQIQIGAQSITATTDVWVKAYCATARTLSVSYNGTTYTASINSTTAKWFNMTSNIAVTGLTQMTLWNEDTDVIFVERVKVVRH